MPNTTDTEELTVSQTEGLESAQKATKTAREPKATGAAADTVRRVNANGARYRSETPNKNQDGPQHQRSTIIEESLFTKYVDNDTDYPVLDSFILTKYFEQQAEFDRVKFLSALLASRGALDSESRIAIAQERNSIFMPKLFWSSKEKDKTVWADPCKFITHFYSDVIDGYFCRSDLNAKDPQLMQAYDNRRKSKRGETPSLQDLGIPKDLSGKDDESIPPRTLHTRSLRDYRKRKSTP